MFSQRQTLLDFAQVTDAIKFFKNNLISNAAGTGEMSPPEPGLGLWQVCLWRLFSILCSPGFRQPTSQEPLLPTLKAPTVSTRAGGRLTFL